jgi:hypothetical protein
MTMSKTLILFSLLFFTICLNAKTWKTEETDSGLNIAVINKENSFFGVAFENQEGTTPTILFLYQPKEIIRDAYTFRILVDEEKATSFHLYNLDHQNNPYRKLIYGRANYEPFHKYKIIQLAKGNKLSIKIYDKKEQLVGQEYFSLTGSNSALSEIFNFEEPTPYENFRELDFAVKCTRQKARFEFYLIDYKHIHSHLFDITRNRDGEIVDISDNKSFFRRGTTDLEYTYESDEVDIKYVIKRDLSFAQKFEKRIFGEDKTRFIWDYCKTLTKKEIDNSLIQLELTKIEKVKREEEEKEMRRKELEEKVKKNKI